MSGPQSRRKRSAVIIARLLSTEGFTDHTANLVESYWRKNSGLSFRQQRQISQLDKKVGEIMKDLPIETRLVIGRFIGLHKKMSFDTGLKIGLQAFATKMDKEIEINDPE